MTQFDFDAPVDRRGSSSTKWQRFGAGVLPLWLGDMDFRAAPAVLEAIRQRLQHGVLGYTDPPHSLKQVLAERLTERGGWQVQPDWMVFLPGLVSALHVACCGLARPQGTVAFPASVYGPFRSALRRAGCRPLPIPLTDRGGRDLMLADELAPAVQPDTDLVLLCNPHNPGGGVYTRKELSDLAEVCLKRDLVLCSDEVHLDLIYEGRHVHVASLSEEIAARTLTMLAPSKTFNLAGMFCSCVIIPDAELRKRFCRASMSLSDAVGPLSYAAAEAAWRHGDDWLRQLLQYLIANRDWLHGQLCGIRGVRARAPQASFFAWIDLRATGLEHPGAHFERFGLGLSDGSEFGAPGWVRLNFGTQRALLEEAVARFRRAMQAID